MSRTGEETPTSTLESPIPSVVTRSSDADSETSPAQPSSSHQSNKDRENTNQQSNKSRNDHESAHNPQSTTTNWPRYLIIKGTRPNKTILQENPFIVSKAIESIIGEPKTCKPLKKSGLLLIEVDKKHHAINLLKTTRLHDIQVEISPHRTLNSSKGVIYCDNLEGYTDEQVLEGLQQHHSNASVTEVYRIKTRREGQFHPTHLFIITFDTPEIPKEIRVAYNNIKVKLYIPNPRRCFNCQMYGHGKTHCKRPLACAKCGQLGHEYAECENDPFCIHCEKNHACSSKICPQWQLEKKILTIKYTENISFYEARQKACPQPKVQKLYSQIVKTSAEISTQTPDWTPNNTNTSDKQTSESQTQSTSLVREEDMDAISANNKRTRDSSEEDLPSIERLPLRRGTSGPEVKRPATSSSGKGCIGDSTKSYPSSSSKGCNESTRIKNSGDSRSGSGQPPDQPRPSGGGGRAGNGKKSSSLPSKPNPSHVPPGTKPPFKTKFNR